MPNGANPADIVQTEIDAFEAANPTINNIQTISVGIRQFTGVAGAQNRYELLSAASVVIILPVAAMFFLLQRRFVAGLTAGAVK